MKDGLLQQRVLEHNDATKQFVLSPKMPETRVKAEQIPQLLESSHARLGESYTALGFVEDFNVVLGPGMDFLMVLIIKLRPLNPWREPIQRYLPFQDNLEL